MGRIVSSTLMETRARRSLDDAASCKFFSFLLDFRSWLRHHDQCIPSPVAPLGLVMDTTLSLRIRPEVAEAIKQHRPVVALESTLVSHGLPWPLNLETARAAEAAVRHTGAIPATIAVLEGAPTIGLDDDQLERVARNRAILKASRRDLAYAISRKLNAATTVAATM